MKNSLNFAVAAVIFLSTYSLSLAQNTKILSNKEILMEVSINPDNKAVIKWISQEDHQAIRFIIQRSRDNETFFDIREIEVKQGAFESRQRLQFAFKDSKMLRSLEHYRIVEYETDGQSHTYSSISIKPESPVSVVKTGDISCVLRVMVDDSKNLTALVSTETGLGVPCEFEISDTNDVILKPAYSLNGGSYLVKLRSSTGEKQFKFTIKNDDVL